jgi:hypothetical protein
MRIAKDDLPVKIATLGAIAPQQRGFGDATDCGTLSAEFFSGFFRQVP